MTNDAYKDAHEKAESDLREAIRNRDYWTIQVAKLEQLAKSLASMSASSVKDQLTERDEIGIQEIIFTCIRQSGERLSATDIRDRLRDLQYDLTRYANPLAVIHSAIKRLVDGRFIEDVAGDGRYSVSSARMYGLSQESVEKIRTEVTRVFDEPKRKKKRWISRTLPKK